MTVYSMLQKLWSVWNMRIAVLLSLWLQIVLIFLSPLRKGTRRSWINAIISLSFEKFAQNGVDRDLAAFWAPFLLLHLGGPDTITAFSVEDNALWMRHFLNMIVEVAVVFYVLFLAIPSNAFWLPFLLVFVAGTIKYAERTRALYLACYGNTKESWSKADSMTQYDNLEEELEDGVVKYGAGVKDHMDVLLQAAYRLYKISRNLIYSQPLTVTEFDELFYMRRGVDPETAFNVVAAELSFIYDALFTKMAVLHRGRGGWFSYFSRLICSALIVTSFVLFSTTKKLKAPDHVDIAVTYALLVGAIFLDIIAVIMLVFSDRTIAFLLNPKASKVVCSIYRKMNCHNSGWCERISQHNFISYWMKAKHRQRTCSEKWFEATIEYFGLTTTFEELRYKYDRNVSPRLKEFIYNYLMELYRSEGDEIISSRGKRTLNECGVSSSVILRSVEMEYERSLFIWHIATDCLYFTTRGDDNNHRDICKVLSDYMFYIYMMRPALIFIHHGAAFQTRLGATFEEIRKLLDRQQLSGQGALYEKLLSNSEGVTEFDVDLAKSTHVLESGSILAKHLQKITEDRDKMWEVVSKVWMEMLFYGAYRSRGDAHAQQLARGGEFITHVWVLMAHFGFNDCFGEDIENILRERAERKRKRERERERERVGIGVGGGWVSYV